MNQWNSLAGQIESRSGVALRRASAKQLDRLRALRAPAEAISFFRHAEPASCAEIKGVRLWPISHVLAENRAYVPGCHLRRHGYLVFATTVFGDAYCFDLNRASSAARAPIVLMAHDLQWNVMSKAEIKQLRKTVARDMRHFLRKYLVGRLDTEPTYPHPEL